MAFAEADLNKEKEELNRLVAKSKEAREAHEEFQAGIALQQRLVQTRKAAAYTKTMKHYDLLYAQAEELIKTEPHYVAALSNLSALIFHSTKDLNWAGFYLMDRGSLLVGPFQGKPACIRIEIGKGVCGTAVQAQKTMRVADVHEFPGHIACDADSRSEIVIPIWHDGAIVGVLDIDSPRPDRFTEEDEEGLSRIVRLIGERVDFTGLR